MQSAETGSGRKPIRIFFLNQSELAQILAPVLRHASILMWFVAFLITFVRFTLHKRTYTYVLKTTRTTWTEKQRKLIQISLCLPGDLLALAQCAGSRVERRSPNHSPLLLECPLAVSVDYPHDVVSAMRWRSPAPAVQRLRQIPTAKMAQCLRLCISVCYT